MVRKVEAGAARPSRQLAELMATILEISPDERLAFVRLARMTEVRQGKHGQKDLGEGGLRDPVLAEHAATERFTEQVAPDLPSESPAPRSLDTQHIGLRQAWADAHNPYKGLRAFQESDTPDFFGREALTQKLMSRFDEETELARFLSVVGPSGAGKSSVVRAGL